MSVARGVWEICFRELGMGFRVAEWVGIGHKSTVLCPYQQVSTSYDSCGNYGVLGCVRERGYVGSPRGMGDLSVTQVLLHPDCCTRQSMNLSCSCSCNVLTQHAYAYVAAHYLGTSHHLQ